MQQQQTAHSEILMVHLNYTFSAVLYSLGLSSSLMRSSASTKAALTAFNPLRKQQQQNIHNGIELHFLRLLTFHHRAFIDIFGTKIFYFFFF
jgi:hypothetical protein